MECRLAALGPRMRTSIVGQGGISIRRLHHRGTSETCFFVYDEGAISFFSCSEGMHSFVAMFANSSDCITKRPCK